MAALEPTPSKAAVPVPQTAGTRLYWPLVSYGFGPDRPLPPRGGLRRPYPKGREAGRGDGRGPWIVRETRQPAYLRCLSGGASSRAPARLWAAVAGTCIAVASWTEQPTRFCVC